MPGFYYPNLTTDSTIIKVEDEEFHHITKVRRLSTNDLINLTNGKGLLAEGRILKINKRDLLVEITKIKSEINSEPIIAAAFSLLKNKHDHMIVEKLTELGIKEFFPIISERTVRQKGKNVIDKFEKVAIAAIKQCDNAYLPKINPIMKLEEFIDEIQALGYELLIASEVDQEQLLYDHLGRITDKKICFFIGPEGGFSEEEQSLFKTKALKTFTMGNHIVRAETAAIAIAAQVLNFYLMKDPSYY